jgi:hypothetical protein
VIDRAAWLAVHAINLAVLELVVVENALESAGQQFLVQLVPNDRPEPIKQLSIVEPKLAVATNLSNYSFEIVEHDVLGRHHSGACAVAGVRGPLARSRASPGSGSNFDNPASRSWRARRAACGRPELCVALSGFGAYGCRIQQGGGCQGLRSRLAIWREPKYRFGRFGLA